MIYFYYFDVEGVAFKYHIKKKLVTKYRVGVHFKNPPLFYFGKSLCNKG